MEKPEKEWDKSMGFLRSVLTLLGSVIGIVLLAGGACVFYAFRIEPYRLQVNEYRLSGGGEGAEEITVVQFSDLHIKEGFTYEDLEKVVAAINEQEPDIVVFTGDLYDHYARYHDDENIIKQLASIEADHGKLAIWGNRDHGGGAVRQYGAIMERAGFRLLRNENWCISINDQKKVLFTGVDDAMLGDPYVPDPAETEDSDYRILLTHEPDPVEDYSKYGYNMVLSGHSHGGQVNFPFLPQINEAALSATALAEMYSQGMYELNADGSSRLYVNTGIGTTHIPVRFGVVPEVAVFHIRL